MTKGKNKIFQKQWTAIHSAGEVYVTDAYYLNICNKVFQAILDSLGNPYLDKDDEMEFTHLACFLTGYFEDIISQTNIWQAFTSKHKELYDKYLPFFELDEYYPDEINFEDVQFLIWYFYSSIFDDDYISPNDPEIFDKASGVYEIFEEEYEFAPENKALKEFLSISEDVNDYYEIRKKIEWVFRNSYLLHFNEMDFLDEMEENLESANDYDEDYTKAIVDNLRDFYTLNKRSNLLALYGKDWLAGILGKSHRLYNDLLSLGTRKTGYFLYKGETEENVLLQHIASDTILPITKKSLDVHPYFKIDDSILFISLVKWQDEWWFSGHSSHSTYDPDLIMDEKKSVKNRLLFQEITQEHIDRNFDLFKTFLQFNKNEPIAYLSRGDKVNSFLGKFNEFQLKSLNLGKEEFASSKKRAKEKGLLSKNSEDENIPKELKETPCLVFYNKNSGLEILFGYNDIIPDEKNKYFEEINEDGLINIFMSQHCSADFIKYLLETYSGIRTFLLQIDYLQYLLNDTDFLLRFWKKNNYYSVPQISII